jgi:hypothetical protein
MDEKRSKNLTLLVGKAIYLALIIGLVLFDLSLVAYGLVVVSKWRMFAVQPSYWWANFRKNIPDIAVGLATVSIISQLVEQPIIYLASFSTLYGVWLFLIKPRSNAAWVRFQAGFAQAYGLAALYLAIDFRLPGIAVVGLTWLLGYGVARLFLTSFGTSDETNEVTAQLWAFCLLVLGWMAWWWNIIYPVGDILLVPQIVLSASLLGYFFGNIVVADRSGPIKLGFWLQQTSFSVGILFLLILLTKWTGSI